VLTYGHLAAFQNPASFVLEFYVAPRLADETDSTIGPYQLGEPIRVPPNFDPDDPLSRESMAGPIATRTAALYWLIRGLREALLGHSAEALQIFRQAETALPNWKDKGEGKENLYFFIGQSELFLNNDLEAEKAFQKALQLNPTYARAQTALGSVYFKRAQCRLLSSQGQNEQNNQAYVDLCRRQDGEVIARCQPVDESPAECLKLVKQDLERTIENYQKGIDLAKADFREISTARARLALGQANYLQGLYLSDDNEANRFLDSAIQQIESLLGPLGEAKQYRLSGQAYQTLGGAYAQKAAIAREHGDIAGSRDLFEQAGAAFDDCIAQGEKIPYYDEILSEQVIANCQTYHENIEEALLNLQGEQP
jgi:tetratricopeptide (TPR) repeat protein